MFLAGSCDVRCNMSVPGPVAACPTPAGVAQLNSSRAHRLIASRVGSRHKMAPKIIKHRSNMDRTWVKENLTYETYLQS